MAQAPADQSQQNILMSAQVFGYAANIYAQAKQAQTLRIGTRLDKQAIGIQMQQETLDATLQSINATDQLREVLSSQRAIMAARGQMSGQGSALALANKSVRAYSQEESARALSTNYNTYQRKAQQTLLSANQYGAMANQYAQSATKTFDNVSLNALFSGRGRNEEELVKK